MLQMKNFFSHSWWNSIVKTDVYVCQYHTTYLSGNGASPRHGGPLLAVIYMYYYYLINFTLYITAYVGIAQACPNNIIIIIYVYILDNVYLYKCIIIIVILYR